jgi:hypothetical protein
MKRDWCRKLDQWETGTPVRNKDPRKALIVAAFKVATGATMVTQVEAVPRHIPQRYIAHCLRKGRVWEGEGYYEIELAQDTPSCAAAMGCLCAGHARGNPADAPCDTSETVRS